MPKVHNGEDVSPGRGRGRRVASSLAEINVVPMVDVMLVLLIIFMVAAPMIQQGIDVNLPVATRAQSIAGDRIEVTVPLSYRQNKTVYLGREPVRAAVLEERVRQKMEIAAKKDVFLRGDGGLNLSEVMAVTDLLKAAGVEHVGHRNQVAQRALMEVTDVLRERMQEPDGLRMTSLVSLLFHSLLAAALIYGPIRWLPRPADKDETRHDDYTGWRRRGTRIRQD